jgi:hypothetical protein
MVRQLLRGLVPGLCPYTFLLYVLNPLASRLASVDPLRLTQIRTFWVMLLRSVLMSFKRVFNGTCDTQVALARAEPKILLFSSLREIN